MRKISNSVYVETGFNGCNVGFVVTTEGIVMIDTPMIPEEAVKWRDAIAKFGTIRYLINTEPHGDHYSGNYFFDGTIIAHEGTREAILNSSVEQFRKMTHGSQLVDELFYFRPPDITFSQRITFYIGKHTFELIHMPGHSPFQAAVIIPEEKIVFTSDNIVNGKMNMPFPHQSQPDKWLNTLTQLENIDFNILVPGHGDVCDRKYIPEMRKYIQTWVGVITQSIDAGLKVNETIDRVLQIDLFKPDEIHYSRQMYMEGITHLYEYLIK